MGVISDKLKPIDGYLISIKRNAGEGWYELEVGLPPDWKYGENTNISCEVVNKNKHGKVLLIKPNNNKKIDVDDLINYVSVIIQTNKEISEKEKEFEEILKKEKERLENTINNFYSELEKKREESFKKIGKNTTKTNTNQKENKENSSPEINEDKHQTTTEGTKPKLKKRRGRPPKKKVDETEKTK